MPGHLLVIEDNSADQRLIAEVLRAQGHTMEIASTIQEGFQQLTRDDFDLILTALNLQDDGGLEFLNQLRVRAHTTEVIVLTRHWEPDLAVRAFRLGVFDVVKKGDVIQEDGECALTLLVDEAIQRRQVRRSRALYEASQLILETATPEMLPQVVVEVGMRVMQADDASLMLPGPEGKLVVAYSHTLSPEVRSKVVIGLGESVAGRVALDGRPAVFSEDLSQDPRFQDKVGSHRVRSSIVYPLFSGDRLVGVLNLNRIATETPFRRSDTEVAAVLASQAVLALENARLVRELRGRIDDLEDTQARLVSSERLAAIGQLAAGVAHEVTNPIAWVVANLNHVSEGLAVLKRLGPLLDQDPFRPLLADWEPGTSGKDLMQELDLAVQDATEGALRIRDIAQDLRVLSRTRHGQGYHFDLNDAVNSAIRVSGPLLKPQNIKLVSALGGKLPVLGNPGQVCQVFLNLIANATQATGTRCIDVRTEREGKKAIVTVTDDGGGIDPQVLPHIFEPFFTTKPPESGTGLGLAISREIVILQGGELTVTHTNASGTCFQVALPMDTPAVNASSEAG